MKPSREVREEARSRAARLAAGLYPHQVEGLAFLLARRGAILADDMGQGKTRQAVLAMQEAEPDGPWLVVCPASVKLNWSREIDLARPGSSVHVVGKSPDQDFAGWVVVNYELLKPHHDLLKRMPFKGVIFDEAHYLKNHTSQRSKLGRALLESRKPRPVTYMLSGTPLTNRPRDLFPLLQMIEHPLGRSFLSFAKRFCAASHNGFGWVTDGASNLEELALQIKGILLRRKKDEVLDLPPKVRVFLDVEVPEGTAVKETAAALGVLLTRGSGAAAGVDRERTRLLANITKARHAIAKAKVKGMLEYVEGCVEQGEKVIVFSCFDDPVTQVAKAFGERAVSLTGKTPAASRQKVVDAFQNDPAVRVFAANIVAGGVGITLTAASTVVFNDLDWVPANHWQAEDRAYRIGQKAPVHVAYMVAVGTIEEFVKSVLEAKAQIVEAVVDAKALGELGGDILRDLEDALRRVSPNLPDTSLGIVDAASLRKLLQQAAQEWRLEHPDGARDPSKKPAIPRADLLDLLAKALSGPTSNHYRCTSSSKPGSFYELSAEGVDVSCTCPGFGYTGMCKHATKLKAALASGGPLPAGYERVER